MMWCEFIGRKIGCSRVFLDDGRAIAVTLVKVDPCAVLGVRSQEKDGYQAVQVGLDPKDLSKFNKPLKGFFSKAGLGGFKVVREIKFPTDLVSPGSYIDFFEFFNENDKVNVTGTSKGRGFTGVLKRHNMSGPPATRGTHEARRNVGSIGCRKYPGKVFKGKRLPGRYGCEGVTVRNLKIVRLLRSENVVAISGAIPGHQGSLVKISKQLSSMDNLKKESSVRA